MSNINNDRYKQQAQQQILKPVNNGASNERTLSNAASSPISEDGKVNTEDESKMIGSLYRMMRDQRNTDDKEGNGTSLASLIKTLETDKSLREDAGSNIDEALKQFGVDGKNTAVKKFNNTNNGGFTNLRKSLNTAANNSKGSITNLRGGEEYANQQLGEQGKNLSPAEQGKFLANRFFTNVDPTVKDQQGNNRTGIINMQEVNAARTRYNAMRSSGKEGAKESAEAFKSSFFNQTANNLRGPNGSNTQNALNSLALANQITDWTTESPGDELADLQSFFKDMSQNVAGNLAQDMKPGVIGNYSDDVFGSASLVKGKDGSISFKEYEAGQNAAKLKFSFDEGEGVNGYDEMNKANSEDANGEGLGKDGTSQSGINALKQILENAGVEEDDGTGKDARDEDEKTGDITLPTFNTNATGEDAAGELKRLRAFLDENGDSLSDTQKKTLSGLEKQLGKNVNSTPKAEQEQENVRPNRNENPQRIDLDQTALNSGGSRRIKPPTPNATIA